MTRFVHIESPAEHGGVARLEAAMESARQFRKDFSGARSLSGILLAAMVAALIVVADQLIDTWADGHLLVAWVALWLIAFSSMALLTPLARDVSNRLMGSLNAWAGRLAKKRGDARMLALASKDPRVLADIRWAKTRD